MRYHVAILTGFPKTISLKNHLTLIKHTLLFHPNVHVFGAMS